MGAYWDADMMGLGESNLRDGAAKKEARAAADRWLSAAAVSNFLFVGRPPMPALETLITTWGVRSEGARTEGGA